MNDRKGLDATDYVVGYARPPKATQFAAGKSGNPKGRPKGSRTVGAILQGILSQKIAVTENGKRAALLPSRSCFGGSSTTLCGAIRQR